VPGDTNIVADLYIRDTCLNAAMGCNPTTILAPLTSAGTQAGMDAIREPALSDDGRYAAFESSEGSYVPTDPNPTFNVFVRDTCIGAPTGCAPSTTRLSAAFGGMPPDNQSAEPALSGDGRFMAFTSYASNLVPGSVSPTGIGNIYVAEAH
jgi:Tol biopolymer transport system component